MTPVTGPCIERLCRPKCEIKLVKSAQRKADVTWYFTFSYNNTFPLWSTKQIWLRSSHLLDAMKHDGMALVLAIKQTPYLYQLIGEILQSIPNTPYLGVTLSTDLKFNIHLIINVAKSYQCLAFVRRNLTYCLEKRRRLSYISLRRSKLEYSSSVCMGPTPTQRHSPTGNCPA